MFGFPAIQSDPPWRLITDAGSAGDIKDDHGTSNEMPISLSGQETSALVDSVQTWRYGVDSRQWGFFLAKKRRGDPPTRLGENPGIDVEEGVKQRPTTPATPSKLLNYDWAIGSLASYERDFFGEVDSDDCFVCFADPSTYPTYPGWMLRNLLVLVRRRWKLHKVQILCYRDTQSRRDEARSIIMRLELGNAAPSTNSSALERSLTQPDLPKVTGWERNSGGRVTSKIANLGEYMDPQRYDTP